MNLCIFFCDHRPYYTLLDFTLNFHKVNLSVCSVLFLQQRYITYAIVTRAREQRHHRSHRAYFFFSSRSQFSWQVFVLLSLIFPPGHYSIVVSTLSQKKNTHKTRWCYYQLMMMIMMMLVSILCGIFFSKSLSCKII